VVTSWTGRLFVGLGVVVLVLLGAQVARVHAATGEFRLTPSEAPPELHELGRLYARSSVAPTARLPKGTEEIGETPGGGEVFGPRRVPGGTVSTVVWVRDDDERVWTYGLVGGP
jgi:hypothetical protein